jgi:pimeloyl-ACP methyl ester carboxylesterase
VKLAQTSTEADFLAAIQPARFGLAAPQLGLLTAWEQDAHLSGDSLYSLLRAWNTYPKPRQTGVICRYEVQLDATHSAPYLVYVPKKYDYRRPTKLLVYYKGGWLNRKELPAGYAKEVVQDNPTFRYLDEQNTIEVFPCLRQDLAIYGNYGYRHLQRMVAQTKRLFNIDDNRVYLSGFSDGGKTVFSVASLTPSVFASFYAISAGLASRPEFATLRARPLLAFVGQADELISPKSVLSYAEQARRFGADWQVRQLPGRKHYYAPYQGEVVPALFQHLGSSSRNPFPTLLTYSRSFNDSQFTGLDWVQLVASTTKKPTATHQVDSVRVFNMAGEPTRYRYGEGTGQVRASCFNNTYTLETSLVDEVVLYISPVMVNVGQPIRVIINGQERYNGPVSYSKPFLLEQFQAHMDRQQLFITEVRFKL